MDMAWNSSKDAILTFDVKWSASAVAVCDSIWYIALYVMILHCNDMTSNWIQKWKNVFRRTKYDISIIISSVLYSTSTTSIFSITSIFLFLMSLHCSFTYLENFWNLRSELFFCAHEVFKCWLFHKKSNWCQVIHVYDNDL